jgi:hypothetical protein
MQDEPRSAALLDFAPTGGALPRASAVREVAFDGPQVGRGTSPGRTST